MFENTFKNIDDILHKDAGCSSELDYIEQTSWILFLKYLDDLEKARKIKAELEGAKYKNILLSEYAWNLWACPKGNDSKIDYNKALTGDDLREFVNTKLFPYLASFKSSAESATTLEYKIGEIFSEIKNKIQSGYNLREILDKVDSLKFQTSAEIHELSHLYEDKIKKMGNAGRNGGEYYTPRPLIQAIIQIVSPKIGDRIYDGAVGSAGFLCESFNYLLASRKLSTKDIETLQTNTFFGQEKKSLSYIIGTMNMILHGIDAPNIAHKNSLSENVFDIQERDRFEVVLANPPFGGKERKEVQQNFPIRSAETAYLFLQHFMKKLKADGKAGIVIKNTFLTNPDAASISLRQELLSNYNLHSLLICPKGVFQGAGVETVVLFFTKGEATSKIWMYELNPGRNLGKRNPLNIKDLADFMTKQKDYLISENSWFVSVDEIDKKTWAISAKNPNKEDDTVLLQPVELIARIRELEKHRKPILDNLERFINV
jgi:type I restriction enzyme M protein